MALLNDDKNTLYFKLFDSRIKVWVHGPVVPELYKNYKRYRGSDIDKNAVYDDHIFYKRFLIYLSV